MITKSLQLPFQFDEAALERDLDKVLGTEWTPHFNTNGYTGGWKSIALLSSDGSAENILAMTPEPTTLQPTAVLQACSCFQEVLDTFHCPLTSARLLNLNVGAEIKPHRDYELGYEDGTFRVHIPIRTNPQVSFILDGEELRMLPGECWYTNVNYVHSVANHGQEDRIHLVIDCQRNEWTDQLFFSLAPEESFQPAPPEDHSREDKLRMMEELQQQNSPAARELAEAIGRELGILPK